MLALPQLQRLGDRLARGRTVEMRDAHEVVEQVRQAVGERVEQRQRILTDRDQDADPGVAARQRPPERVDERSVGAVVEDVLLELVEDQEQRAIQALGGVADRLRERSSREAARQRRRQLPEGVGDRLLNTRLGIGRPRAEVHRRVLRGQAVGQPALRLIAHVTHHAGAQQRALADTAGAVEDRHPVGEKVVDDDRAERVTAEEVLTVVLAVGHQPLVWPAPASRIARAHPHRQVRGRLIVATQSSRRALTISTRWRCQNSSSIGSGARSIAHEPKRRVCSDQM